MGGKHNSTLSSLQSKKLIEWREEGWVCFLLSLLVGYGLPPLCRREIHSNWFHQSPFILFARQSNLKRRRNKVNWFVERERKEVDCLVGHPLRITAAGRSERKTRIVLIEREEKPTNPLQWKSKLFFWNETKSNSFLIEFEWVEWKKIL